MTRSVAEARAKAKASLAWQLEHLTEDIILAITTVASEMLTEGMAMQQLEPDIAQLLLIANIGLAKCIKLIKILSKVPINMPNRVQVICPLMHPHLLEEDKCKVYINIIEKFNS